MATTRIALITGPPGVGKTTLTKKLCEICTPVEGFYTEEVRGSNGVRLGFDVVSLGREGSKKPLAREFATVKGPKVGKYTVYVSDFESIALPCIEKARNSIDHTIIIDEIGKMELCSSKFENQIKTMFESCALNIIATIPIPKGKPIPLIESLKNKKNSKIFEVTKSNRDSIDTSIMSYLKGEE